VGAKAAVDFAEKWAAENFYITLNAILPLR
jgi:hypothetical protein